jgi:hypothetical protein
MLKKMKNLQEWIDNKIKWEDGQNQGKSNFNKKRTIVKNIWIMYSGQHNR